MQSTNRKPSIHEWAEEDRPREKMLSKGAGALSDAELLGILIGSGNADESAVELMRRILRSCDNNLNELGKWSYRDFSQFKGIGEAKATTIMSALELGKRRNAQEPKERSTITSSIDIYKIFHPKLCDLPHEEFWILLLNQSHKYMDEIRMSFGGIDGTYVDVRSVLREAILRNATRIVLTHNHPSGNKTPSAQDRTLTRNICLAAQTMNITVVDHVIVCDGSYYSFADEGELVY